MNIKNKEFSSNISPSFDIKEENNQKELKEISSFLHSPIF